MALAAELTKISKTYTSPETLALKDITLSIPKNSVTTVFGPNGVGKSTLLRIIALLEDATSGQIKILGNDVGITGSEQLRGRVAMVFQNPAVFDRTVYDNIAYGLRLRSLSEEEIDHKVREKAEMLGLTPMLAKNAKALSRGQKQRVVIGRTVVVEPELLLLDEPNANLDLEGQRALKRLLTEMCSFSTVVVATPNLEYALSIGDNFVLLDRNQVLFSGSGEEFTHSSLAGSYRY